MVCSHRVFESSDFYAQGVKTGLKTGQPGKCGNRFLDPWDVQFSDNSLYSLESIGFRGR